MSGQIIQQRKFVVKAGMTVDDVKNSKEATALQKKYASAFDTDGQKGFSQKEADLFNATTFAEKSDGTVIFWTRQKDGTKKGTKFGSKDNNIQFKSEDEVKPYIKKVAVKKSAAKKEESVSFFDEAWSGHMIAKVTGDNDVTDWLQNKDKVCTDGKDDGKIGFWEGAKSLAKGIIGGIPKAVVNHPVATIVAVGVGAAAVTLTGGAILPVLGAIGVVTGVGMTGYGAYKSVTAETDGEAKQALETLGMGMTTTVLSVASADKVLEKAAEAGVKSAQVSEDAGIIEKTVQMFKAIPEALSVSGKNIKANFSAIVGSASSETTTINANEVFLKQKSNIEKHLKRVLSRNVRTGNLNKSYKDPVRIQKVLDAINEDNIDFALKLLDENVGYDYASIYAKYSEENCNYLLNTVPRLLKSNDINVQRATEYILGCSDINDKMFTLDLLNKENALEILSYKDMPSFNKESFQQLLMSAYRKKYPPVEYLPFIEDSSHKNGDKIYLKIYAKNGVRPKAPGIKTEEYVDQCYHVTRTKYILYESSSDKQHNIHTAQQIAKDLLNKYGYEAADIDSERAAMLMKNGCKTQEDKQWLADFILSDKYKLAGEK